MIEKATVGMCACGHIISEHNSQDPGECFAECECKGYEEVEKVEMDLREAYRRYTMPGYAEKLKRWLS